MSPGRGRRGAASASATGAARLVYVAPERFSSARFLDAIAAAGVARLAVDEAHCLSEWGHDFRPDYLRLADVRERLGSPPTIALTATATPRVAARTSSTALRLRDPVMPRTGSTAPTSCSPSSRWPATATSRACSARCCTRPDALPAVVYCGRRRTCEEVAEALSAGGLRAAAYHAGLDGAAAIGDARRPSSPASSMSLRRRPRSAWASTRPTSARSSTGRSRASPEEYYQQAGRAGPRRAAGALHAALQPARQGPDRLLHQPRAAGPADLTGVHAASRSAADAGGVFRVARARPAASTSRGSRWRCSSGPGRSSSSRRPMGSAAGRVADAKLSKRHLAAAVVAGQRVERQRWDRLTAIDAYATERRLPPRGAAAATSRTQPSSVPPDPCCDVRRTPAVVRPARRRGARADARGRRRPCRRRVLHAVDETEGRSVGRGSSQILRGSRGRALRAAGHDRSARTARSPRYRPTTCSGPSTR